MRSLSQRSLAVTLALGLAACGGSGGTGPSGNPSATVSAKIDGQNWAASASTANRSGGYIIIGSGSANGIGVGLGFPDQGAATYDLGVGANNANVVDGSNVWTASAAGGSGSIVVTSVTATEVIGTFSFTGVASGGVSPATRVITSGKFDVKF